MISERVIENAVKQYETALRMMSRDNMPIHAFDVTEAVPLGATQ